MDGNGRWAKDRGKPRPEGHKVGATAVKNVVTNCRRLGVKALTLYAFSEQNWARPEEEVDALMHLLKEYIISERDELLSNGIRVRAIGRIHRLPKHLQKLIADVHSASLINDRMTLTICLSYGGREEIADAAQALAKKVAAGEIRPDQVNEDTIGPLVPSLDVGPVDLLIRTGGETRISNFLLWAGAYAELFFSPTLWPEYSQVDLYDAIYAFQQRNRRFGLAENVAGPEVTPDVEESARAAHG